MERVGVGGRRRVALVRDPRGNGSISTGNWGKLARSKVSKPRRAAWRQMKCANGAASVGGGGCRRPRASHRCPEAETRCAGPDLSRSRWWRRGRGRRSPQAWGRVVAAGVSACPLPARRLELADERGVLPLFCNRQIGIREATRHRCAPLSRCMVAYPVCARMSPSRDRLYAPSEPLCADTRQREALPTWRVTSVCLLPGVAVTIRGNRDCDEAQACETPVDLGGGTAAGNRGMSSARATLAGLWRPGQSISCFPGGMAFWDSPSRADASAP